MTAKTDGPESVRGRRHREEYPEDGTGLEDLVAAFRKVWWKAGLLSIAVGAATFLVSLLMPNIYQATATITPSSEESKPNPALGAIASLGFQVGPPSKIEDLEILLKSNALAVRVFSKHNLWAIVLGDRFDAKTGNVKPAWTERIIGGTEARVPGEWDAVRAAKRGLNVAVNRRAGSISLSFESRSPQGSADIVRRYLDEAKNRLQEEALERATRNKRFIEEQMARTADLVSRERLYSMLGQEMEKEMMARNREQFGFRIVDPPMVPDRKSKPARGRSTLLAVLAVFVAASMYLSLTRKEGRRAART